MGDAGGRTDGDDLWAWFDAFREQSHHPERLGSRGPLTPKPLGGGKSGAGAALFRPESGAVVLKWHLLENILSEAQARKARDDQAANLQLLRERGASHVAIRQSIVPVETHEKESAKKAVFGIMAYPYVGPTDLKGQVGDFEWFIRDKFLLPKAADDALREYFELLLYDMQELGQDDKVTDPKGETIFLPDLRDWATKMAGARRAVVGLADGDRTLDELQRWFQGLNDDTFAPSAPDSRLLHGDLRFANIMVDTRTRQHSVHLIDFGGGDPKGGGHVFRDLARFEVDVVMRASTPVEEGTDRLAHIRARTSAILLHPRPTTTSEHRVKVAEIWREVRDKHFRQFTEEDVRQLHAMFVAVEFLRRLNWHLNEGHDSGGTVEELLLATRTLMEAVPRSSRRDR